MVGREHDASSRSCVVVDHLEDAGLTRQVESGDWLVEKQHIRLGGNGLGHEYPLALATGELSVGASPEVEDLESFSRGGDGCPIGATEPVNKAPVTTHSQHLIDRERHPGVVRLMLGDERDTTLNRDGAGGRLEQAGDQVEQRGLPAAVGANKGDRSAAIDGEVGRSERDGRSVMDAHTRGTNNEPAAHGVGQRRGWC
jgi:hypothetical protein